MLEDHKIAGFNIICGNCSASISHQYIQFDKDDAYVIIQALCCQTMEPCINMLGVCTKLSQDIKEGES